MRLSNFILGNLEPVLQEWEAFARTVEVPRQVLDATGLRNHAVHILRAVALDMRTPQSRQEQIDKSQGLGPQSVAETAAQTHAVLRLLNGFSLDQMVSEYRALRSSVLRLWLAQSVAQDEHHVEDMIRFNEAIDQALVESISAYGLAAETNRKMFLGVLGHNLRTPLTAVIMGADLLHQATELNDRHKMLASQIAAAGQRANQIVNDLLDLARCNLGAGIPIQLQSIDLGAVCASVVAEVTASYPQAQLVFKDACEVLGEFDPVRMGQAFANLLANAAQHGDLERPIHVTLKKERADVYFAVKNFGEPIPSSALPFLFKPEGRFSRFASNEQGASAGLGLGLFVAAEIVAGHRGHIEVESTAERGTTFRIVLPLS